MQGQSVEQSVQNSRRLRDERLRIRHWRRDQFAQLGFPPSDARALAKSPADLGEARKLIAAGCAHKIAFRIVR